MKRISVLHCHQNEIREKLKKLKKKKKEKEKEKGTVYSTLGSRGAL